MGRLRLFDARLNDGVVDFDMSSPDPQRIHFYGIVNLAENREAYCLVHICAQRNLLVGSDLRVN